MQIKTLQEYHREAHLNKRIISAYRAGQIKILREEGVTYKDIANRLNLKSESNVRALAKKISYYEELHMNDILERRK